MKKFFTHGLFIILLFMFGVQHTQAQYLVYAPASSGVWASVTWNKYPSYANAIAGTGSTGTGTPGSAAAIFIPTGDSISIGASVSCKSLIVQTGGILQASSSYRLQIGASATEPQSTDTVQIDGRLGGPTDGGLYIEPGVNAQTINITGAGTIQIARIRLTGGADLAGNGVLNFNIKTNMTLTQTGNYALTAVYTPKATDNYTLTIASGVTVRTSAVDGFFHNSQAANSYGNYTYNILGTLDLSANTQTSNNLSANFVAPSNTTPANCSINLIVNGGTLKLGGGFKADTTIAGLTSTGILNFQIINGGVVDASNTSYLKLNNTTTNGVNGVVPVFFEVDATGTLKQTVGSTYTNFPLIPVGDSVTAYNTASINNIGTSSIYTMGLQTTVANTPPAQTVPRQWNIAAATAGSNDTMKLAFTTADIASSGFNPAAAIFIIHWNGSSWDYFPATLSGTGTQASPYVAKASGITSFSPYAVTSTTPAPVTFSGINAVKSFGGVNVNWDVQSETGITKYIVERSIDGVNFSAIGEVAAAGLSSYTYADNAPVSGIGYYKVEAVSINGAVNYSTIAQVATAATQGVAVVPSVVTNGSFNLQLNNIAEGNYTVNVYSTTGQKVFSTIIHYAGGASTQSITLPADVAKGLYNVNIINASASYTKGIVVE